MKQNKNLRLLNEFEINSVIGGQQFEELEADYLFYSQNASKVVPKKPKIGILTDDTAIVKK